MPYGATNALNNMLPSVKEANEAAQRKRQKTESQGLNAFNQAQASLN